MKNTVVSLLLMCGVATLTAANGESPETMLVTLGTAQVTNADADAMAQQLPPEVRAGVFNSPDRIGQLLETLVVRRAIVQDVLNGTQDIGLDIPNLRETQSAAVLRKMQLEREIARLSRPDSLEAARQIYTQRPEDFQVAETVTVRHILIGVEAHSAQDALEQARELHADLLEGKISFEEAVAEFSDDPSHRNNHGLFERVGRGQMVPAFEQAAFALQQPGEVSEPVRSRFGYHIIRLEERHPQRTLSFEEARPRIESSLLRKELRERELRVRTSLGADADQILLQRARQAGLDSDPEYLGRLRLAVEEAALREYRRWYADQKLKGDFETLAREYFLTHRDEFKTPLAVTVAEVFVPEGEDGEAAKLTAEYLTTVASDVAGAQLLIATPPPGVRISEARYVEGEHDMLAAKLAFGLQTPGQTSQIVTVSGGYLFLSLLLREPPAPKSFEAAQTELVARLRNEKEQALWAAHVAEFHQLPSEANPDAIAALRTRYIDL